LEIVDIQEENERFKYNKMLLAMVADNRRERVCRQVHGSVSCYH